ncbi:MAG: right-handed parallel beta-helix repeat-containing protein [Terriglobales bacterium]
MKSLLMQKTYLLVPVLFVLLSSSFAGTYYVGSCHSSSYSTISAAVAAVPPSSTIDVCPGTYPEQVFIYQPLTLQGIKSGNNDRARIVVPISVGGPPAWHLVPDPDGYPGQVAPQIFVNAPTGTVKISNLTIDASGETTAPGCTIPGFWFTTAIMYQDSSGTVNEVNTVGQGKNSGCGVGIRAAAVAATSSDSVTITNNSIQDTNYIGLYVESASSGASLKINVSGNTLVLGGSPLGSFGIELAGVTGTIASNSIEAPDYGIAQLGGNDVGPLTISNNIVHANSPAAVWGMEVTVASAYLQTVSGNKIVDFYGGISLTPLLSPVAVTVKSNVIVNSHTGIDLRCISSSTLSGNIVNNAATGIDNVPTGFSLAGVSFYNVDQIKGSGSCS